MRNKNKRSRHDFPLKKEYNALEEEYKLKVFEGKLRMPSYNRNQLTYYASTGNEEAVKYCLAQGRDPNILDTEGMYSSAVSRSARAFYGDTPPTPLLEAVSSGRFGCAALLLEAGADPHLPAKDTKFTPMHIYPVAEHGYHHLFAYYMDIEKFSTVAAADGRTARDRMFHISLAILQKALHVHPSVLLFPDFDMAQVA